MKNDQWNNEQWKMNKEQLTLLNEQWNINDKQWTRNNEQCTMNIAKWTTKKNNEQWMNKEQ